jgi:hypothetical protein
MTATLAEQGYQAGSRHERLTINGGTTDAGDVHAASRA